MFSDLRSLDFKSNVSVLKKDSPDQIYRKEHRGEQGWRSGESTRLPSGIDSRTLRHMWVEFVGSLLCSERVFSGYSGFPHSSKKLT